jgi:hypothetical protein
MAACSATLLKPSPLVRASLDRRSPRPSSTDKNGHLELTTRTGDPRRTIFPEATKRLEKVSE